jgi:hypothetical protein
MTIEDAVNLYREKLEEVCQKKLNGKYVVKTVISQGGIRDQERVFEVKLK